MVSWSNPNSSGQHSPSPIIPLCSRQVLSHIQSFTFIHFYPLLFTFIHFYSFSFTFWLVKSWFSCSFLSLSPSLNSFHHFYFTPPQKKYEARSRPFWDPSTTPGSSQVMSDGFIPRLEPQWTMETHHGHQRYITHKLATFHGYVVFGILWLPGG